MMLQLLSTISLATLIALSLVAGSGCGNQQSDSTLTAAPGVQAPVATGPAPTAMPMHTGSGAMRGLDQLKAMRAKPN
jgi:hypothetical protein